ncbi:translation factor GTPase family protein [Actinokineospora enzanensis]|uniref:translation factor GTPase family protein n=1 Tax=Actinokineospora enzanensis TaxID=155975 RepID=UPI00316ADDA9
MTNLGVLAHVDAGKTSLTERLLYTAGVIDEVGSVDDGSTRTDTLELERRRGITIKAAVVSFALGGRVLNLIDTPGHPDFIAEVERVLGVLDGAVLVVSAVEGIQAQTRVLFRTLRRLGIPTLLFVNKIDRRGADGERVLRAIRARLTPAAVAIDVPEAQGTAGADRRPRPLDDLVPDLVDVLADDALLADYLDGTTDYPDLRARFAAKVRSAAAHPVYFGSAATGAGVDDLCAGIREFLPAAAGDPTAPLSGTVFKVERGDAGEKIAYLRLFAGTLRTRDRVGEPHPGRPNRVTRIDVFDRGTATRRDALDAGRIGKLWGLGDVRVGDVVGARPPHLAEHHFAPPTLETAVVPRNPADRARVHAALTRLAEQDPLVDLRQDEGEIRLSLYGEVQKEVIEATLAEEFGVAVAFRETTTIHIERLIGIGHAAERLHAETNPYLACVGIRVEPSLVDSGMRFDLEVEPGSMPPAFFTAIEETVRVGLGRGPHGWRVPDCRVVLTECGYLARQSHSGAKFDKSMSSTAGDFRGLTALLLARALSAAGTRVEEPVHGFTLDIPTDALGAVLPVLTGLRAVPGPPATQGESTVLTGEIPAAEVHRLERRLPALTSGEGVLETTFSRYRHSVGEIPTRSRESSP